MSSDLALFCPKMRVMATMHQPRISVVMMVDMQCTRYSEAMNVCNIFAPNVPMRNPRILTMITTDAVNSTFFALALANGLSAAIMNPYSADMMRTYYAFKALKGMDENCGEYISHSGEFLSSFQPASQSSTAITGTSPLMDAVIKGLKEKAVETTKELLFSKSPLDIVNEDIIPALNKVGEGFEKNIIFF